MVGNGRRCSPTYISECLQCLFVEELSPLVEWSDTAREHRHYIEGVEIDVAGLHHYPFRTPTTLYHQVIMLFPTEYHLEGDRPQVFEALLRYPVPFPIQLTIYYFVSLQQILLE